MCDTLVALGNATTDGTVILAKNSDREANEAQQLEYHPPANHAPGSMLSCTYLTIPQVPRTYGVWLARPFWMWGAEMGMNDQGVAIGNEAVFTRLPVDKGATLTGMDLLRLALERGASATEAKDVIVALLQQYGQGGAAGYTDKSFRYHNSFIIADPRQAWVLETAGRFWVAKQVKDVYAISNGLTIGSDYDDIHPQAEAFARKKGWAKGRFSFADAFSDKLYTHFSACRLRQQQSQYALQQAHGRFSVATAMQHLRSHYHTPYRPDRHWLSSSICAHAGNPLTRHAAQTTGSLVAHLSNPPLLWVTATAAPCLSVFKPLWPADSYLPDMGPPLSGQYDETTYWWHFERLHRQVLQDYPTRAAVVQQALQPLEEALYKLVYEQQEHGRAVTDEAFGRHRQETERLINRLRQMPLKNPAAFWFRSYWRKLNRQASIPVG